MDDDALDFEILNFIGVENLSPKTVKNFPNLKNCFKGIESQKLLWYILFEGIMFKSSGVAMNIIRIQMIYYENLHGFMKKKSAKVLEKLKTSKKELYEVYKIFHRFIMPKKRKQSDRSLDQVFAFFSRIYTTFIYGFILYTSISTRNICFVIFIYLIFFFDYFVRMNLKFLNYLETKDVERMVDLSKKELDQI